MSVPTTASRQPHVTVPPELYGEVLQFYARHMHLLDEGDADGWAATFTADGSFSSPSLPEPIRGRDRLAEGAGRTASELSETGETHRHIVSTVDVLDHDDTSVTVRAYTQVLATPRNQPSRLHLMTTCHDVLLRQEGRLYVSRRRVLRDDQR